jgi:hypothetical protein
LGPAIPDFSPLYSLCTDNPKTQAIQLISYHLKNRRENANYHLPPSLQPTTLQRTIPHESVIDGLVWAGFRDRLIRGQGQFATQELFTDLLDNLEVSSDKARR